MKGENLDRLCVCSGASFTLLLSIRPLNENKWFNFFSYVKKKLQKFGNPRRAKKEKEKKRQKGQENGGEGQQKNILVEVLNDRFLC